MAKSATTTKVACEDCFFRCNLLCALELDEPCATFRPEQPRGAAAAAAAALQLPPGAAHAGGVGVSHRPGAGRAARLLTARDARVTHARRGPADIESAWCRSRCWESRRPGRTRAARAAATSSRTTGPAVLRRLRQRRLLAAAPRPRLRRRRRGRAVAHARRPLPRPVPYAYALTYAPRQQPVPSPAGRAPTARRGRGCSLPPGGGELLRAVARRGRPAGAVRQRVRRCASTTIAETLELGTLRARFQPVPHFIPTNAIELSARDGGGRFTYGADHRPDRRAATSSPRTPTC